MNTTYKVETQLDNSYQVDLSKGNFSKLIGFTNKVVTKTKEAENLPNITNDLDVVNINTDAISDSLVDGNSTETIATIPVGDLTRSFPFTYKKQDIVFNRISPKLYDINFWVTDSLGRTIDLNDIDWTMTVLAKTVGPKTLQTRHASQIFSHLFPRRITTRFAVLLRKSVGVLCF